MPYQPTQHRKREAISTVFQQGKIQLPAIVRNSLNIKVGEKIVWIVEDGKWIVEKA